MAEANKGIALTILGVVAVIAIVGLVLLFTGAGTGKYTVQASNVYGGAMKEVPYPYLMDRKEAGAYGDQYAAQYTGIPGRTRERGERQIPVVGWLGCPLDKPYRVTASKMALMPLGCEASEDPGMEGWYCCDSQSVTSEYWNVDR